MQRKKKRVCRVVAMVVFIFMSCAGIVGAQERCILPYMEQLRQDGYVIEYVTILPVDLETNSVLVRFTESTQQEKKIVTVNLEFTDECLMEKSTVEAVVYLKKKADGGVSTVARYRAFNETKQQTLNSGSS